jgi:hypothetical protein
MCAGTRLFGLSRLHSCNRAVDVCVSVSLLGAVQSELWAAYVRQLTKRPLLTKSCTSSVLLALQEIAANKISRSPGACSLGLGV